MSCQERRQPCSSTASTQAPDDADLTPFVALAIDGQEALAVDRSAIEDDMREAARASLGRA